MSLDVATRKTSEPWHERAFLVDCQGEEILSIYSAPEDSNSIYSTGVVIVVGGPQYRVGSHRQFVLLARHLAAAGIACLRFDCRGMGDSTGKFPGFEHLDPDIACAIDTLAKQAPSIKRVVLWGLCDGASAATLYATKDERVAGLVLLNPWVRTAQSEAATYIKHYYLQRLLSRAFWTKFARGGFGFEAMKAFISLLNKSSGNIFGKAKSKDDNAALSLPERMAHALTRFPGQSLILLSEHDYVAREFEDSAAQSARWKTVLANGRCAIAHCKEADHTFSSAAVRQAAERSTLEFILALPH